MFTEKNFYLVEPRLCNENADDKTRRIFGWLCESFGRRMITAQQLHPYAVSHELDVIRQATGKQPAMLCLDFMDYSPNRVCYGSKSCDMERAVEWSARGGLVSFCWHWNAPMHLKNTEHSTWASGFYTQNTDFDIAYAMANKDSDEYAAVLRDIDEISRLLTKLMKKNVTVLWRPLHEASGGWFWWGAGGSAPYIELWRLMYERMTFHHKLSNLIWVWNGQDKDWYPGDDCVDIIGEDIYDGERCYFFGKERFTRWANRKKPIALSETGTIPDIDRCFDEGTPWLWFCPWYGGFILEPTRDGRDFRYSERHTGLDIIRKMYHDKRAVTLDNLPQFDDKD